MLRGLLFVICSLIVFESLSQNKNDIYFEHYSQAKGLSQGSGYTAVQFDDFMWFGTQDGLNRFDGYEFEVYKSEQIIDNFIQSILNDEKGHLWVGTSRGLNIYYPKTNTFQTFNQFLGKEHPLQSASVKLLMRDRSMNIWILTDGNGIFYFDWKSKTLRNYPEFSNRLIDVTQGGNGRIFIATDEDIYELDTNTEKFVSLNMKGIPGISNKTTFRSVLVDSKSRLWVGTYEDGIFILEDRNGKMNFQKHYQKGSAPANISSDEITRMMQDSEGRIWIGTRTGGISIFNPDTQSFDQIVHAQNEPLSISENYILSFYEDRQNNVWVGTSGGGFDKYDPRKYQFGLIRRNERMSENSISDNMIFKIFGHDNYLYFGTQSGGLNRFDPTLNQYQIYKSNPEKEGSLLHNEVYDIADDREGNLWLALGKGLSRFDPKTQSFQSYFRDGQEELVYMYTVKVLRNEEVWTGGQRGLFRYDIRQEKYKNWDDLPEIKAISKYVIRLIYEDTRGDVWLGTIGQGLLKYSPATRKITRFDKSKGIDCANIRAIFEDGNTLWIGSDCGAYRLDAANQSTTKHLTDANGLPNNVVYAVLKDKTGRLWFSSNRGLTVFNPLKGSFKSYNASDGLQSDEFNTSSAYLAKNGTMYFGGVNGISFFKPESLTSNLFVAPVRITNIKVMDQVYKDSLSLSYVKSIDLPYDQNYIFFEFAAFNFSNSERNTYRYKMDGLENKWVNAGNRRSANYTNLPPGNYTFLVKGANNDGVENPVMAKVQIHIHPPFWQTVWFRILMLLAFLGIVYLIYRNKIISIRNEEKQKSEIRRIRSEAEMAVLRAQISPDFIFNSLNAIEAYTLTNRRREASHYLQIFSKLIRMVIENSRQELVSVEDDLQALRLFVELEEERYDFVFRTEFDIDPDLIAGKYQIPPLLIQPFVESAIADGLGNLETKNGMLKISLTSEKSLLKVKIEDNRNLQEDSPNAVSQKSILQMSAGMYITKKRIEALGNLYETRTECKITETETGLQSELLLPLMAPA